MEKTSRWFNALLGREPFICFLAFLITIAWLATYFLHLAAEQTLTNVVMIIIGYFYGSSSGSKKKDEILMGVPPLSPNSVSSSTETTTKTETSSKDKP